MRLSEIETSTHQTRHYVHNGASLNLVCADTSTLMLTVLCLYVVLSYLYERHL